MPIQLRFTFHERDLLLSIEPEIVMRLKHAMLQANTITINIDEDEIENLLGAIAGDASHAKNRKLENELDTLFRRVEDVLRIHLST